MSIDLAGLRRMATTDGISPQTALTLLDRLEAGEAALAILHTLAGELARSAHEEETRHPEGVSHELWRKAQAVKEFLERRTTEG